MIGFFPKIYEDELLFSQMSRYYQRAGYCLYSSGLDDLYSNRIVRPSIEFVNRLNEDAYNWVTKYKSWEEIILNHTMFSWYGRFLEPVRRKKAYETLIKSDGNIYNMLMMPKQGERSLRYCPFCAKEDRQHYGETYWHRKHQIARINVCPEHKCYLEDTKASISSTKSTPFYVAELTITDTEARICTNERELAFAKYVLEVFNEPLNMEMVTVSHLLRDRLEEEYKLNDYIRKLDVLHTDIESFFKGMTVMDDNQMRSVYNSKLFDAYYICQAAFFEGIQVKELCNVTEQKQGKLHSLYEELAAKYMLDVDIVSMIGKEVSNYLYNQNNIHKKTGRVYDYDKIDEDTLPKVIKAVEEIVNSDGRPQKVSVFKVEKMLKLPQKRIEMLPRCKEYIECHMETQQEYWGREIIWAVKTIKANNEPLNWKHIRNLTNMRPDNLIACVEYIDDDEVNCIIKDILKGIMN